MQNKRTRGKQVNSRPSNKGKGNCQATKFDEIKNQKGNGTAEGSSKYDNDPSWYAKNPQSLIDSASITTSNVAGYPIHLDVDYTGGAVTHTSSSEDVPGILTLCINPSIGSYDTDSTGTPGPATSAVNLAAKNIYSYVRHANSGASNYDSPDLMCAILAADQVFSAIAMGIRAYGIAMNYSQKNRYTPMALLSAMGFDPENIISNLAQFRYHLNNLIARASVIWVPSDMSIVARHYWMYSNIYTDSANDKAQFYMYVPNSFWKFEPTAQTTGSSLSVVPWGNLTEHTIYDYYSMVSKMLDPIISDEDMGIMFGDLLKAYGKDKLYTLDMIPENYTVLPTYNAEVLSQIHNATAVGAPGSAVKQKNNVIYQSYPKAPRTLAPVRATLLNYNIDSPSPEAVMVSTRLHALTNIHGVNDTMREMSIECGSEYVEYFVAFYYQDDVLDKGVWYTMMNANTLSYPSIAIYSKFDWAPIIYVSHYTQGSAIGDDKWVVDSVFGDLDNYTVVGSQAINKMNTTALFSEFNVPIQV